MYIYISIHNQIVGAVILNKLLPVASIKNNKSFYFTFIIHSPILFIYVDPSF